MVSQDDEWTGPLTDSKLQANLSPGAGFFQKSSFDLKKAGPSPLDAGLVVAATDGFAPRMQLIAGPMASFDASRPAIAVTLARRDLATTTWQAVAADGQGFRCAAAAPLRAGDTIFATDTARYVLCQQEEPVVEVPLDLAPSAAAGVGWAFGNEHLPLCAEPTRLLAPDEPAVRQLLARLRVPYRTGVAVFRPGRFSRGGTPPAGTEAPGQ
jgi:urease accessory protein